MLYNLNPYVDSCVRVYLPPFMPMHVCVHANVCKIHPILGLPRSTFWDKDSSSASYFWGKLEVNTLGNSSKQCWRSDCSYLVVFLPTPVSQSWRGEMFLVALIFCPFQQAMSVGRSSSGGHRKLQASKCRCWKWAVGLECTDRVRQRDMDGHL